MYIIDLKIRLCAVYLSMPILLDIYATSMASNPIAILLLPY
nr:MAG TPA: hypothetical protein [Caudoviricetes sp.]